MSELRTNLPTMASVAFSTKPELFSAEAIRRFLEHVELRCLMSSQWGAIHTILSQHGADGQLRQALRVYFGRQRKKAVKKDTRAHAAAFAALEGLITDIERTAADEFADVLLDYETLLGAGFPRDDFSDLLQERAVMFFFGRLTRMARIHEGAPDLSEELTKCLLS
jgi:hypothetical protein